MEFVTVGYQNGNCYFWLSEWKPLLLAIRMETVTVGYQNGNCYCWVSEWKLTTKFKAILKTFLFDGPANFLQKIIAH